MTDLNGDGFLGNFRGNVYVLGRKKRSNILTKILTWLLIVSAATLIIGLICAYYNNELSIEALQMLIAGR